MMYMELSVAVLMLLSIVVILTFFTKLLKSLRKQEISISVRDFTKGHHWVIVDAFEPGHYCNICDTSIFHGVQCDFCGIICDDACAAKANSSLPCKSLSTAGSLKHHWVHGNLPLNSICVVCDDDCGIGPGLKDFKCCWCQITCHESCISSYTSICDTGKFKRMIIPPNCVKLRPKTWKNGRGRLVVNQIVKPEITGWKPVLIVANRKSGNGEGDIVLQAFRRVLNPAQIFDLCEVKPDVCLKMCQLVPDVVCQILVAGGDGTVGWILNTVEKLRRKHNINGDDELSCTPEIYVLPLGTGNDLSRVLGFGAGHDGPVNPADIMKKINECKPVWVDRWSVAIDQKKLGVQLPRKLMKMTNYASLGVDALVTLNFHRRRYTVPRVMSGRLMNKLLFFTYGTKDVLERACSNLHNLVELRLDDVPVALPELEGITVLNIPYWGAGVKVWDLGSRDDHPKQNVDDGYLEVFGLYSSFHIAQLQVGLSEPHRLGRAKEIQLTIKEGVVPMQVDGEPWRQGPAVITISHFGRAKLLASPESDLIIKTPSPTDKTRSRFFL